MRSPGLLVAGLAALVAGVLGLLVVVPVLLPPTVFGGWQGGPGGLMGAPAMGGMMSGMAGLMGGPVPATAQPIGIERAGTAIRSTLASFGDPNLEPGEVMEFAANYYAQVVERDTGLHAFELLVDKSTGAVFPEMGPNLVWNTKYGMVGGMLAGWRFATSRPTDLPIDPPRAQELARAYLRTQRLPLDVAEPDRFYGYYTLHTLRNGEIEGMLSVNGFTGEVWYHVWHGPFIPAR